VAQRNGEMNLYGWFDLKTLITNAAIYNEYMLLYTVCILIWNCNLTF
jgi:hypothetical protein